MEIKWRVAVFRSEDDRSTMDRDLVAEVGPGHADAVLL